MNNTKAFKLYLKTSSNPITKAIIVLGLNYISFKEWAIGRGYINSDVDHPVSMDKRILFAADGEMFVENSIVQQFYRETGIINTGDLNNDR